MLKRTEIKRVNKNGNVNVLFLEEKTNSIFIEWNRENAERWQTRSEWLHATKTKGVYTTMQNWDELFESIEALGGVRLKYEKSYISDWGDGDCDKFTSLYFKFEFLA